MPDIAHWFDNDLTPSATGDLLSIDGLERGRQRILRRLLTNPGDYIWHPEYGAGLGRRVGQLRDINAIRSVIRTQIMEEACVGKSPLPAIDVTAIDSGVFVSIKYLNVETGAQDVLSFDLTE